MLAARPAPRVLQHRVASTERAPLGLLVLLGATVFLFTASEGTVRAFFNVYLDTRLAVAPAQIGATMGLGQMLPVVAALSVPTVVARFGTTWTLMLVSLIVAAGLVALGAVPLLPVAGLAYMTVLSMAAMHAATRNIFSQQLVGVPWRATSAAILSVGMGLGWASAAAGGGLLLALFDFRGLFGLTGGLAASAAVVLWGYQRVHQVRLVAAGQAVRPGG
jgi:hypothetical protein